MSDDDFNAALGKSFVARCEGALKILDYTLLATLLFFFGCFIYKSSTCFARA